jgi:hypothetical protein
MHCGSYESRNGTATYWAYLLRGQLMIVKVDPAIDSISLRTPHTQHLTPSLKEVPAAASLTQ